MNNVSYQKVRLKCALIDELLKTVKLVLKKHRCSHSRVEICFLEQSVALLKEYKKAGGAVEPDFQLLTEQVTVILLKFLFSGEDDNLEDFF